MDMHVTTNGLKADRPLDRDKINMVPRGTAATVAHEALFPIQERRPEQMLMGVATLFAAMCRRCRVDPQDMHVKGLRVLDAPEDGDRATDAQVQVLRDLIGAKVMGEEVTLG